MLTETVPVAPAATAVVGRRSTVKAGTDRDWGCVIAWVGTEVVVVLQVPPLIRNCHPSVTPETDPE
jgi:hypothetical protein